MGLRLVDRRILLLTWILLVAFAAIACGGGETETPAAAPTAAAAPSAGAPATAPAVGAVGAAPGTCYIIGELVADCPPRSAHTWQPPREVPGEYWEYQGYDGPRPTIWYESPMSYQLVKAGELPPLDQRVPPPEDRGIVQGPSGIGEYGGQYRQTNEGLYLGEWITASWAIRDSNGMDWHPWVGKSWELSDDGRTYTMRLRRNMFWSDGEPFTMDNIRVAWEDFNYNEELNKFVSLEFRDPVTDNVVEFKVVDELTWTLSYDTPVYNLFELRSTPSSSCSSGTFAYYCHPYMLQYHPKYTDADRIKRLLRIEGLQDWTQLVTVKNDVLLNPGRPCLSAWCTSIVEDTQLTALRNHYYYMFDPEGNQLPYIDETTIIGMESREAAVFRGMNGENDGQTTPFQLPEVPIYNANMEKGDYSIYHWPSTGGNDAAVTFSQTFNEDPEIGKWLRTRDFRLALSLAIDRDDINDSVFLGIGVVQSWVPHPSTPYYPGPEVARLNVQHDVDRANQIPDAIGLDRRDAEGFRLRTDPGRENEPLLMDLVMAGESEDLPVGELILDMWKDVGIKTRFRLTGASNRDITRGREYLGISIDYSAYQANPWCCDWNQLTAMVAGSRIAPEIGEFIETQGARGMKPGANDEYLPLAPKGAFPADTSGNISKLIDLWQEGRGYPAYDPRRIEIGKQLYTIAAEELYALPTVAFTGTRRGIFLNRNNVRNQPRTHIRDHNGFHAWTYFFEGGKDNMHNSENRSAFNTSESFLGG